MKPFNGMNGWGIILSIQMEKKKYLSIKLGCEGLKYGNVKIYLNVWSKKKAEGFLAEFKKGDTVKVRGFMGQYKGRRDRTMTSVTAHDITPWDPENDQHSKKRMTFVLVGKVVSFRDGRDEGQAEISLADKYDPLKVCIPSDVALDIREDGFFRIKGAMMMEEEDHGDLVKPLRPVAEEVEEVEETVPAEGDEKVDDDKKDDDIPF